MSDTKLSVKEVKQSKSAGDFSATQYQTKLFITIIELK